MGLTTSRRLKASGDFARLRAEGTSFPARYMVLSVLKSEQPTTPWRCGLITTRKIGNAVQRNRTRRRLRELVRATPLKEGVSFVLIARWRAPAASFEELRQDWLKAAHRARLLASPPAKEAVPA